MMLTFSGMKIFIKVIYDDFKVEIVDGSGIEQVDARVAGLVGDTLPVEIGAIGVNNSRSI
jgi:hypothetical protein